MNPTNLYEYYKAQGKTLPSLQERSSIYETAGLGKAADYISQNQSGNVAPNTQLLKFLQSGAGAPPPTPPATDATKPPVTPATVYKDLGALPTGPMESPETIAARKDTETYLGSLQQPDENKIYQDTLAKFQAEIDAQNKIYADELERAKVTGAGRLGSETAMQGRRGLLGSDFGEAGYRGQEASNEQVYKSIEAEKAAKIASILSDARSTAAEEIKAKREAFVKGLDARLEYYNSADERKTTNAGKAIQSLIAKGISPKEVDPAQLKQLAGYYGVSVDDIVAGYDTAKKAEDAAQAEIDLKAKKSEADISKIEADIAKGKIIELSEGGMLYNTETGETFKNPKTFAPKEGGSGGGVSEQLYAGLSTPTSTAIRGVVGAYKTEPLIQNFGTIQDGYNFASSLADTTKNPADDQALIYSLAKALDPGSVVREGEYATAQKYAQSWVKAYGKGVTQALFGTGFLSEEARKNIKSTIKQKYTSSKKSYDQVNGQYVQRINNLTGRADGDKFLTDYVTPENQSGGGTESDPLGLGI